MPALKTYLVEDSPLIREQLVATLEELAPVQVVGWAADETAARQGLAAAGSTVGLVIVDLFLASGSGLSLLRAAVHGPGSARWVVLSNYASPEMRRHCLALGAARVFDKSTEVEALLAYCRELASATGSGRS
jgi:DNA-binding NarL/FixJ family response regulator